MKPLLFLVFGFLSLLPLKPALAQAAQPPSTESTTATDRRPVIGLALSGGGARGIAHVGVLKVLEELRVPIDLIVATSAGAAAGGLYAMGLPADEITARFLRTDFQLGLRDQAPRDQQAFRRKQDQRSYLIQFDVGFNQGRFQLPRGLSQGQHLRLILNDLTDALPAIDFDDLPVPYRAVATDLTTGEEVVLERGHLAQAIHASMAIPGVYEPVQWDDRLLVDGGIANNLPIEVARRLGAEVVIAVDISAALRTEEEMESVLEVMDQLTNFLTRRNVDAQIATLRDEDVLIVPSLSAYTNTDFDALQEMLEIGTEAARSVADQLSRYSLSPADYQAYRARLQPLAQEHPIVERIRIDNRSHISDDFIRSHIRQKIGTPLRRDRLEADIRRIYGLGYFGQVSYQLNEAGPGSELVINAQEKSWGPNYLRFGLNIEEDFEGESNYNLATQYTLTALNRLGAEWVNVIAIGSEPELSTEIYQPLSFESSYFVSARAEFRRLTIHDFDDGQTTAQYRVQRYSGSVGLGKAFGNWGQAELRLEAGRGKTEVQVGPPHTDPAHFNIGEYQLDLSYDTLDSVNFPTKGARFNLNYAMSRPALGADKIYDRLNASLAYAHGLGRYTVTARATTSQLLRREGSVENAARLGGFLNLSGYRKNELTGEDAALLSVVAYRRFGRSLPYYLGGSFEMGNVWTVEEHFRDIDLIKAGSLFAGVDTFLGPVVLAVGYAGEDNASVYLNIGQMF